MPQDALTSKQAINEELDVIKPLMTDYHPDDVPIDELVELIDQIGDGEEDEDVWNEIPHKVEAAVRYSVGFIRGMAFGRNQTIREMLDEEGIQ